jgi:hypothetical protein
MDAPPGEERGRKLAAKKAKKSQKGYEKQLVLPFRVFRVFRG